MAIYNYNNVIGCETGQFSTEDLGQMNFPILVLDGPINPGDNFGGNNGISVPIMAEFSTVYDKPANSTASNYIMADGATEQLSGGATLTRTGNTLYFRLGAHSTSTGYMSTSYLVVAPVITVVKGSNGVFALLSHAGWRGAEQYIVYQSCSLGRQGYATYSAELEQGSSGPPSNGGPWNSSFLDVFNDWMNNHTTTPTDDPYNPGGESGPGGGDGDFDGTSEDVDFPDDPALSAVDTGFLTLFNPTVSQLNSLANFMWGSIFDIENWKKIFANPMDAILGLSMVPVSVPDGGSGTVKVGNIDTGVSMTKAAKQYVNVDCGAINVKEYWGAYLDYSPYTKAEIFLPYIGTHEVSVDDLMGKTVHIKYKVDILSGACVANIKCGGSVLYSYSGQCAATIPITGRDWTQTLSAALSVAGNVLSIAASQGMTAPMAATNIAQSAVNAIKPNIQKTGNIGGMAGIMGIQKPYIILTRPRQAVPKNQNKYTGYPSFITAKLSKCDGYTEVETIHLDSTTATQDEIREIETLLDKGVIF